MKRRDIRRNDTKKIPHTLIHTRPTEWNKIFRIRELWVRKIGGDNSKSNESNEWMNFMEKKADDVNWIIEMKYNEEKKTMKKMHFKIYYCFCVRTRSYSTFARPYLELFGRERHRAHKHIPFIIIEQEGSTSLDLR